MDVAAATRRPAETQRYKAPQKHGGTLLSMATSDAVTATSDNQSILNNRFPTLRERARTELLHAALLYSRRLDASVNPDQDFPEPLDRCDGELAIRPLIMTGHQPELVHPGVWFKYVMASQIADASGGIAVNIVVDNDTIRSRAVSIPKRSNGRIKKKRLRFDDGPSRVPWEDATVQNLEQFQSFANRLQSERDQVETTPILTELWPYVSRSVGQGNGLADAFTTARRLLDQRLGLQIFDIPLSQVSQFQSFAEFCVQIFADLPRFRDIYNQAILDYRAANGIRSETHPLTELELDDGWIEAPFWMWRKGEPTRRRLFARCRGSNLEVSDRQNCMFDLPCPKAMPDAASRGILDAMQADLRIRTRALTTTIFTRLFLSDLFIHGIGGAKYDEMTDQIIGEFFNVRPPEFLVATATLQLPHHDAEPMNATEDVGKLQQTRRRMMFNPEEFVTSRQLADEDIAQLVRRKQSLIEQANTSKSSRHSRRERRKMRDENRNRHHQFKEINRQLHSAIDAQISSVDSQLKAARKRERDNTILQSREYPYVLFPANTLRELVAD